MFVEVSGVRYPISNDFDPDHGQWWAWEQGVPVCDACGDTLVIRDGSKYVDVESRGWDGLQVVCPCGATKEIQ